MKNLIWIVLAAVVLGGGYMLVTGKSVTEVVEDVSQGEVEAPRRSRMPRRRRARPLTRLPKRWVRRRCNDRGRQ